ncbi:hypothetical protein CWC26_06975 [Pseudoalteromonas sp. S4488]|uniref:PRTRC system ParB family protein n=1 Tax=Pseudoalteromonas sp. S4488 TaxID=579558 RepID=UPI0011096253|nr:PRTRC system ParB family protein [Pseudoalteromonas sp. S4488]TMO39753.1 hypothetical protein CWC26_06975 [Pseudoalteromonas sp. S4488]
MNNQNNVEVQVLKTVQLVPFALGNSREKTNREARKNLTESIKEAGGVLQPILVRPTANESKFEVVAGFGRWEACIELGFDDIPALIKPMTDNEAYEAQLIENLVRDDLTIVDESKAAQKFITMYQGDYSAAAERLGWTQKKLNDRVQLLRCCDDVLNALNENKIKIGHATILSSFSEKLQIGTLGNIINENWSVEYLKQRAGKAKKYLHTAKFDTKDCAACPHNTSHQIGMFDFNVSDKAACAKLSCWNVKTDEWLKEQKKLAEEKYGTVILLVECSSADRNTVSRASVGESQYNEGCASCESNVVIMDDRSGREGQTLESQCIDKVCFAKCVKAFNEPDNTQEIEAETKANSIEPSTSKSASISTKKPQPVVQKTPSAVLELEKKLIHQEAEKIFANEAWYVNGVVLASMAITTGYKPAFFKKSDSFNENVLACKPISNEQIQEAINQAVTASVSSSAKTVDSRFVFQQQALMISAMATLDNAKDIITAAWNPSEKVLKNYTGAGIKGLCVSAGFDKAFNDCEANKSAKHSFSKIAAKSKGDFIKAILAFNFDWSSFAPDTIFKHLK